MVATTTNATPGRSRVRVWLGRGLIASTVTVLLLYVVLSLWIGFAVREARAKALQEHDGDQVSALMAFVDTETHSLRERDRAVWALGQLGDPRALPLLEKYTTGKPCDHDRDLCQGELAKATALCRGGFNLSALVWRHGSLRP